MDVQANRPASGPHRAAAGADLTLVGLALTAGVLAYGTVAYPASARAGGAETAVVVAGLLLAYAAAATWVRTRPPGVTRTALGHGARVGVALGAVGVLNLALEHFVGGRPALNAMRGVGMWAALFLGFGAAGSGAVADIVAATGVHATVHGTARGAVLASVWSGLVAAVAMVLAGWLVAICGTSFMVRILAPEFAASGMADPRAFVVRHTAEAAAQHLLLLPVVAAVFGALGGAAAMLLPALLRGRARPVRRRAAWALGGVEGALALGGVAVLRLASILPRSARPPLVISGLLALGLALACAHAVLRAVRPAATA